MTSLAPALRSGPGAARVICSRGWCEISSPELPGQRATGEWASVNLRCWPAQGRRTGKGWGHLNMEKLFNENEGKLENEGKPEDEVDTEDEGKSAEEEEKPKVKRKPEHKGKLQDEG